MSGKDVLAAIQTSMWLPANDLAVACGKQAHNMLQYLSGTRAVGKAALVE